MNTPVNRAFENRFEFKRADIYLVMRFFFSNYFVDREMVDLLENEGLMEKTESRYEKVLTLVLLLDLLLFLFYFCLLAFGSSSSFLSTST